VQSRSPPLTDAYQLDGRGGELDVVDMLQDGIADIGNEVVHVIDADLIPDHVEVAGASKHAQRDQ
jgi:hypothetical protein